MNQTSLVGRPLYALTKSVVKFAEKRGVWSGPLMSSSPELARLWGAPRSSSGVSVSEHTALNYGPVWACVKRVSDDVSSTSFLHYKRLKDGGKERLADSTLYEILHDEANPRLSAMGFRRALTAHMLTWGNGYAEIQRDGTGKVVALWPITPDRVKVKLDAYTGEHSYEVARTDGRGGADVLPARDMFHIAGLAYDGLVGYSVIALMRETIGLGLATERFGGAFFGNGSTFGGVVSLGPGQHLTDTAAKSFKASIGAEHEGVERAHRWLLLGNDAKYTRIGIPPNDAQFLETRQFQANDIAMWFGVPPHKIGILDRSTNNNIAHQDLEYYINTLRPVYRVWEQEARMKLIPRLERKIQFVEHLQDSRYVADLDTRYRAYATGRNGGWLSINDIRILENMNPVPGGDIYVVQGAMVPIDRLDDVVNAQVRPPAPPAQPPTESKPKADDDEQKAAQMMDELRHAMAQMDTRIATAMEQVNLSVAKRDESDVLQTDAWRAELDAAREERGRLQALLLETTARADQLAADKEAARLDADAATAALDGVNARLVSLDRTHLEAAARAQALQAERDQLAAECVTATARVTQMTAAHDAAVAALQLAVESEQRDRALAIAEQRTAIIFAEEARDAQIVELSKAEHNLLAMQAHTLSLETRVEALRAEQDALTTATAKAEADATQATEQRQAAEQAAADITAKWAAERAARTDAEEALAALKKAEADWRQGMMLTHRDSVLYHMGLLVEKETTRARANKGTPAKLRAWAESYYLLWEDTCVDALRTDMRNHLVFIRSPQDVDHYTRAILRPMLTAAAAQIRAIADGDADDYPVEIERVLTRWAQDRPAAVADLILQEEVTYVRSL